MKYVSLFAGIGGFDLALNRQGHECVYASEWDKYSAQTYEKNFNHKPDTRSIRDVSTGEIPDHELLVGGFPCQSFSVAGKRAGFQDIRGTLFFEIIRIARAKRTPYLLLENVKGLLSHDAGKTFYTIIRSLDKLGYDCQWQVLNSKNFGVPQNRERVFIVGHLRGEPRPKVFPIGADDETHSEQTDSQTANTLTANYWKGPAASRPLVGTLRTHKDGNGFRTMKSGLAPTIPARARNDGSGQPVIAQRIPLKFLNRNQRNIEGDYAYTVDSLNTGGVAIHPTLDANYYKGMSNQRKMLVEDMKIRRLTPVECERLQGFPDNWTQGVSDTQRYKQLGNAVTVNVVQAIAERLPSPD